LYGTGALHRSRWMAEAVRVSSRYVVTYHVRMLPRPLDGSRVVRTSAGGRALDGTELGATAAVAAAQ
jgi:hypothetical protein